MSDVVGYLYGTFTTEILNSINSNIYAEIVLILVDFGFEVEKNILWGINRPSLRLKMRE